MSSADREVAVGLHRHRLGRLREAAAHYQAALTAAPDHADANHYLGVVLLQNGQPDQALPFLKRAAAAGRDADCHNRLGLAYASLARPADAMAAYDAALSIDPDHAETLNNRGLLLGRNGRHGEAESCYRKALAARPDFPEARNNLGALLLHTDRPEAAAGVLEKLIADHLDHAEGLNNLGNAYMRLRRPVDAATQYRQALRAKPEFAEAHVNLSACYAALGYFDKAYGAARAAVTHGPDLAGAWIALASSCRPRGRFAEGLGAVRRAEQRGGAPSVLAAVRSALLLDSGEVDAALDAAKQAVAAAPDNPEHRMNLGTILLLKGRFRDGFAAYDARWETRDGHFRDPGFPQARWRGEPLDGKAIMIWREQGIGEEIMFASVLPEIAAAARAMVIASDPRMVPLFARAFPDATVVARDRTGAAVTEADWIDMQAPLGEACRWRRPDPAAFPAPKPYLAADPDLTRRIRDRYRARANGRRLIGIAWRSAGANPLFSASKTTDLSDWEPLLRAPDCQFIDLQHGDTADQRAAIADRLGVDIDRDDSVDQIADLDAFAAQIAALDGVVTTSNTTAHMAGALGQNTIVILPHIPDWRWQLARDDSLWYPRVSLCRQPRPGAWRDAIARAAARLQDVPAG